MRRLSILGLLVACIGLGAVAHAAMFEYGNLRLTADGAFAPQKLPRRAFAPISFKGWANVKAVHGGVPDVLQQVILDFDHDGRLSTRGLPTCDPALLDEATPKEARARCSGAIVGTGHVEALIAGVNDQAPIRAASLLTLFNGPREAGHPTVILHARTTVPATQNYAITIPITKEPGNFRYRAEVDVPPIAAGLGALTHIDVKVGRRYRFAGKPRSYVSARCSDGFLATRGRFTFSGEDGGVFVDGSVEKGCSVR